MIRYDIGIVVLTLITSPIVTNVVQLSHFSFHQQLSILFTAVLILKEYLMATGVFYCLNTFS